MQFVSFFIRLHNNKFAKSAFSTISLFLYFLIFLHFIGNVIEVATCNINSCADSGYYNVSSSYILNLFHTGGLFHCYMLAESICRFREPYLFCRFLSILMEMAVSKQCRP